MEKKSKITELNITDLIAYNIANDNLIKFYENQTIINCNMGGGIYEQSEEKRQKYVAIRDLIINEMVKRVDALC